MTRTRAPRRSLRFDRLEARDNPAGSITATQVGSVLTLTGDDLNNQVQVRTVVPLLEVLPDVTVTGLGGTQINSAASKTFSGVTSLRVLLHGGDDLMTTDPAAGEFEFFGPVAVDLGDGNNTLTLDPVGRLLTDRFTVTAGDGNDTVTVAGDAADPSAGGFFFANLNLGDGDATVALRDIKTFGPIRFTAGAGDHSLSLDDVELVRNGTTTGQAEAVWAKAGDGSLAVSLTGNDTQVSALTAIGGGDVHVSMNGIPAGSVAVTAGQYGEATLTTQGDTTVARNLSVKGYAAGLSVPAGSLDVGGNVSVVGAARGSLTAGGTAVTVGRNLTVSGGQGTQVSFATTGLSEVKGNASVRGGVGADTFETNAQFKAARHLSLALGGGANAVAMSGTGTSPTVGGNLSITTGAGADATTLDRVRVAGTTAIRTGAGADTLVVRSGSTFTGSSIIDLGAGTDLFAVAGPGGAAGPVTFTGKLTARMGAGNDTLILGTAGDGANGQVVLEAAANLIDGGAGQDLFDAQAGQFDPTKVTPGSVVDPTP